MWKEGRKRNKISLEVLKIRNPFSAFVSSPYTCCRQPHRRFCVSDRSSSSSLIQQILPYQLLSLPQYQLTLYTYIYIFIPIYLYFFVALVSLQANFFCISQRNYTSYSALYLLLQLLLFLFNIMKDRKFLDILTLVEVSINKDGKKNENFSCLLNIAWTKKL